jgi:hypothetical protein
VTIRAVLLLETIKEFIGVKTRGRVLDRLERVKGDSEFSETYERESLAAAAKRVTRKTNGARSEDVEDTAPDLDSRSVGRSITMVSFSCALLLLYPSAVFFLPTAR